MKEFVSRIVRGNFSLCFEKARLITQSHKQTESEPAQIRYANAHANVLENISVTIDKDELFTGEGASKPWETEKAFRMILSGAWE